MRSLDARPISAEEAEKLLAWFRKNAAQFGPYTVPWCRAQAAIVQTIEAQNRTALTPDKS